MAERFLTWAIRCFFASGAGTAGVANHIVPTGCSRSSVGI
jgi:hypothetical protein